MDKNNFLFLSGKRLKLNKNFTLELRKIYGIGKSRSEKICKLFGIGFDSKVFTIKQRDADQIEQSISYNYLLGKEVASLKEDCLKKIKESYQLLRARKLAQGYPANGQRTRSNAKTAKYLKYPSTRIKKNFKKKKRD